MRKIINSTYVTLDGDQEKVEEWHFDYMTDEVNEYANELVRGADAIVMGRGTYEGFAPAWMGRAGQDELSDRMNEIAKYVVSSTLEDPEWNNTSVLDREGAVAAIRELREAPGADILTFGFGPVARTLLQNGMLDELRFWVHPVLAGVASVAADDFKARFELAGTKTFDSGVVVLTYTPRSGADAGS